MYNSWSTPYALLHPTYPEPKSLSRPNTEADFRYLIWLTPKGFPPPVVYAQNSIVKLAQMSQKSHLLIPTQWNQTQTQSTASQHAAALPLRWHLAANPVPPGGACHMDIFPDFPSTLSPTSFLSLRTLITRNSNPITVTTIQYLITMIHYSYIQFTVSPFKP